MMISATRLGSSPHTWGILLDPVGSGFRHRFIPTYVGHTLLSCRYQAVMQVHPHIRGAYGTARTAISDPTGSSPHTWGIRLRIGSDFDLHPVHPHIRGAYCVAMANRGDISGSSPHTWGILIKFPGEKHFSRFIPTYVGHTHSLSKLQLLNPVHPHIRGAYVSSCKSAALRAVHPHIRGAYCLRPDVALPVGGSSPHTWGILDARQESRVRERFIPTYVGHT